MLDLFSTLEKLSEDLKKIAEGEKTKAAKQAYYHCSKLLIDEIESIKANIIRNEDMKLANQMAKFDVHHMNYDELSKRGHIGIPDDSHKELSDFSLGIKTATEVFDNLSEDYKFNILSTLTANKEVNERLTAYRHGFHFITHSQGHDGINLQGQVFEVKNRKFVNRKERLAPVIKFDRVSPSTARKFREGKPHIIFNITDNHKVLIEMKIAFGDNMLDIYDKKVSELRYSKTSGFDISFKDFKDHIIEITHIDPSIYSYNIQKNFLDFIAKFNSNI